jgi:hypothetical protein
MNLIEELEKLVKAMSVNTMPHNDFDKGVIFGRGEVTEHIRALLAAAKEEGDGRKLFKLVKDALAANEKGEK